MIVLENFFLFLFLIKSSLWLKWDIAHSTVIPVAPLGWQNPRIHTGETECIWKQENKLVLHWYLCKSGQPEWRTEVKGQSLYHVFWFSLDLKRCHAPVLCNLFSSLYLTSLSQLVCVLSCSVESNSLQPHGLSVPGILQARILEWVAIPFSRWFPNPEIEPGLLYCRRILYCLYHQGSPRILDWVAYIFSSGSYWPRNRAGVSCITGKILYTSWATREASLSLLLFKIMTVIVVSCEVSLTLC